MVVETSRRERKKAATRQAIADAALRLFLEHGYDAVGVREVAEAADVAIATLFAHFPSKEALVFDQDTQQEQMLVTAVQAREPGESVPEALRRWFHAALAESRNAPDLDAYHRLIDGTPALTEYAQHMWTRHEQSLADAIAVEDGQATPSTAARLVARTALQTLAALRSDRDAERTIDEVFAFLDAGWTTRRRP